VAAVAAPIAAIAAVVGFTLAIKAAADELIKANHELAKFSPAMAQVFAQRDVQEIFRERDRGNALAPDSAAMLVREEQRYRDAIFPMETAWEELKNNFLAGFYSELADIAEGVRGLAEMVGIELKRREQPPASDTFSGQINKIADKAARRQLEGATRAGGGGQSGGAPGGAPGGRCNGHQAELRRPGPWPGADHEGRAEGQVRPAQHRHPVHRQPLHGRDGPVHPAADGAGRAPGGGDPAGHD
jgi:hypothetical protein